MSTGFVLPPNTQAYYEQVWAFVRQIPVGKVATYGQIRQALPAPEGISEDDYQLSASRWVGSAMAACPDDVPWQRVINAQGKISRQVGAAEQKQRLLDEGVLFTRDKVDLDRYQWQGPGQSEQPVQGLLF